MPPLDTFNVSTGVGIITDTGAKVSIITGDSTDLANIASSPDVGICSMFLQDDGTIYKKILSTDQLSDWVEIDPISWIDVAGDVEYTGVETIIASGEVLTCIYKTNTIYRLMSSTENVNGYPVEDSFYSDFDGTNLTNLITTRGQQ
jgi:hypothetical protein